MLPYLPTDATQAGMLDNIRIYLVIDYALNDVNNSGKICLKEK